MEGARLALLEGTFPTYRARFQATFVPPDESVAAAQRAKRPQPEG